MPHVRPTRSVSAILNSDGLYFHHVDCLKEAHDAETQCHLCQSMAHTLAARTGRKFVLGQERNASSLPLALQELEVLKTELEECRRQLAQPFEGILPAQHNGTMMRILTKLNDAIAKDPDIVSSKIMSDFENALDLVNLGTAM